MLSLTELDFIVIFFASGAVIAAFIVAYYLLRRFTLFRRANLFLGLFFIGVGFFLIDETLSYGGFFSQGMRSFKFYYLPTDYTWSFGPLLYFYVRRMIRPNEIVAKKQLIHFVMPLTQAVGMLILGLQSVDNKLWFWQNIDEKGFGVFDEYWTAGSMLVYGIAAWWLTRQEDKDDEMVVSAESRQWLRMLLIIFIGCSFVAGIIQSLIPDIVEMITNIDLDEIPIYEAVPTMIFGLSAFIISARSYTFNQLAEQAATKNSLAARKETYAIEPDTLAEYTSRLKDSLATKPYLDPNVTLGSLATQLDIPSRHLSYVVNEMHPAGFSDWINQHRVESACAQLADPGQSYRSVLDVGLDSGFSSKSTFNRVFKQYTGQTPSQFRAAQKTDPRPKSS